MKIDFEQELKMLDGKAVKMDGKSLTFRAASVEALLTPKQEDTGNQKAENYALAIKIHQSNGQLELKIEEVNELKKRIGEHMTAIVVGQCWKMLEGQG